MDYSFAEYQIAEIAAQMEEEGFKFYRGLETLAKDDGVKIAFDTLARQELEHKANFLAIAASTKQENKEYEYSIDLCRIMNDAVGKLKRYAFDLKNHSNASFNVRQALRLAINMEEEAIKIYGEIRNAFIERFYGVLDSIIAEEKKHLQILKDLQAKLTPQ